MEEEKAVAYYDELTRKGGGAARFKQGLGFSSSENDAVPVKQTSSSSFLSNFVRASSPTTTSNLEKQSQLESIQNKLKKKPSEEKLAQSRVSKDREKDRRDGDRERDRRDRDRERDRRDRDRDRERDRRDRDRDRDRRGRDRDRERDYRDYRDRDRGRDHSDRDREGDSERDGERRRRRRSVSPPREKRDGKRRELEEMKTKVDYSRLIEGYDKMVCLSVQPVVTLN